MRNEGDFRKEIRELVHQHLDHKRQSEAQERRRQKRRRIALIVLALLPVAGPPLSLWGYMLYQDIMRQRVAMQFIRAVEQRDGKTLCELATPEDHLRFNLTPEKAQATLDALFHGLGTLKVIKVRKSPPLPNQANPDERFWRVYWGDGATGTPLPDKMGDEAFYSRITIKSTIKGYRADFWGLLTATAQSRWGYKPGIRAARNIRKAIGLS